MFAEDAFQKISLRRLKISLLLDFRAFFRMSLRNLRGRLLSSEKFSDAFALWVFTLKPFPATTIDPRLSVPKSRDSLRLRR